MIFATKQAHSRQAKSSTWLRCSSNCTNAFRAWRWWPTRLPLSNILTHSKASSPSPKASKTPPLGEANRPPPALESSVQSPRRRELATPSNWTTTNANATGRQPWKLLIQSMDQLGHVARILDQSIPRRSKKKTSSWFSDSKKPTILFMYSQGLALMESAESVFGASTRLKTSHRLRSC